MKIEWSRNARLQLNDVVDHLAAERASAAARLLDQVDERLRQIAQFPHSGRPIPEAPSDTEREVIVMTWRIGYHVSRKRVRILYVIHAARQFPRGSGP